MSDYSDWQLDREVFKKVSACLRAILSGPLRELQERSARGVLQLEARSISRSRGRTLSGVVEPSPIPISTLGRSLHKVWSGWTESLRQF